MSIINLQKKNHQHQNSQHFDVQFAQMIWGVFVSLRYIRPESGGGWSNPPPQKGVELRTEFPRLATCKGRGSIVSCRQHCYGKEYLHIVHIPLEVSQPKTPQKRDYGLLWSSVRRLPTNERSWICFHEWTGVGITKFFSSHGDYGEGFGIIPIWLVWLSKVYLSSAVLGFPSCHPPAPGAKLPPREVAVQFRVSYPAMGHSHSQGLSLRHNFFGGYKKGCRIQNWTNELISPTNRAITATKIWQKIL